MAKDTANTMSGLEKRSAFSLATIFAFRMLGLFMILPVFAIYAHSLHGATPTLIGLALGIYGLTQALLQIPFGMLSDRIGRKSIITLGLLIFIIGSIIAATSHTIIGVIIGRGIQGAGAVGSTIIALVADLTREENRTKAMAIIGMIIGLSFTSAMVLGPLLGSIINVPGIFWLTAGLGAIGILVLHLQVPTPKRSVFHRDAQPVPKQFMEVIANKQLQRLDIGIFILHGILTASFIALPIMLQQRVGLAEENQWYLYLPVLVASFFAMVPFIIIAEKKRRMKTVFVAAIATLAVGQLGLVLFQHSLPLIALSLFIFFTAFTLLEASLPSLISKIAPAGSKGTAIGIYSSSQFLGIFCGGLLGGWLYGNHHISSIFLACALLALIWVFIAATMAPPPHLGTHMVNVGNMTPQQAQQLENTFLQQPGVAEAAVYANEGIAYLKVDNQLVDKQALNKFSQPVAL